MGQDEAAGHMNNEGAAWSGIGESGGSQLRPRSTSGSRKEESCWKPPEFRNSGPSEKGKGHEESPPRQYVGTAEGGMSVGLPGIDGKA